MASIIVIVPKKNPELKTFLVAVDQYFGSQQLQKLSDFPRIYFSENSITSTLLRHHMTTLKNTKGYKTSTQAVYYESTLKKV